MDKLEIIQQILNYLNRKYLTSYNEDTYYDIPLQFDSVFMKNHQRINLFFQGWISKNDLVEPYSKIQNSKTIWKNLNSLVKFFDDNQEDLFILKFHFPYINVLKLNFECKEGTQLTFDLEILISK